MRSLYAGKKEIEHIAKISKIHAVFIRGEKGIESFQDNFLSLLHLANAIVFVVQSII